MIHQFKLIGTQPHFNRVSIDFSSLVFPSQTKEYHQSYMKTYYHKRRAVILNKLGNVCGICGSVDRLQVCSKDLTATSNHFNLSNVWSIASNRLDDTLTTKCQLLCKTHRVEAQNAARKKQPIKHGAYYAYFKKKCRCDDCIEYNCDLVLRRREGRREFKKAGLRSDGKPFTRKRNLGGEVWNKLQPVISDELFSYPEAA